MNTFFVLTLNMCNVVPCVTVTWPLSIFFTTLIIILSTISILMSKQKKFMSMSLSALIQEMTCVVLSDTLGS